jgi:hypothetical protein
MQTFRESIYIVNRNSQVNFLRLLSWGGPSPEGGKLVMGRSRDDRGRRPGSSGGDGHRASDEAISPRTCHKPHDRWQRICRWVVCTGRATDRLSIRVEHFLDSRMLAIGMD